MSAWVTTDEDGERGFLVGAPTELHEGEATSLFIYLFREQIDEDVRPSEDGMTADLRPYRNARPGDEEDGALYPCKVGEEPDEMVWVVQGFDYA